MTIKANNHLYSILKAAKKKQDIAVNPGKIVIVNAVIQLVNAVLV
jgi:hypothetical protein